ncbi:hypothetical protein GOB57_25100 [Sinorhizobium meliloti]|nr:hypothetical protein [Sinorhizobium meliloti]
MRVAAAQNSGNANALNVIYMDVLRQAYSEIRSSMTASPRHQEWFHGAVLSSDASDSLERTVAMRVAEKMKQRLYEVGESNYDQFASKLARFPHQLRKSVASGLIPGHITHGVCRFAQTVEKHRDTYEVVRFFVTNGEVAIDPDKGDRYLTLLDRTQEKVMYYGLAQTLDRSGRFIGINRDKGDDGVMFLTDDKREALFNIAAISTSRTPDDFRRIAVAPAAPQPATSPRF